MMTKKKQSWHISLPLIAILLIICTSFGSNAAHAMPEEEPKIVRLSPNSRIGTQWDLEVAKSIALQRLYYFGGPDTFGYGGKQEIQQSDAIKHAFIGFEEVKTDKQTFYVLFYYSRPAIGHVCRACGVSLSMFHFEQYNQTWLIGHEAINFDKAGEWGTPPDDVSLFPIKGGLKKGYAIKVAGNYTNSNTWRGRRMDLFMDLGNNMYEQVFHTWLKFDAPWNIDEKEKRNTINTRFELDSTGKHDLLDIELVSQIETYGEKSTCQFSYQFNGKQYQPLDEKFILRVGKPVAHNCTAAARENFREINSID